MSIPHASHQLLPHRRLVLEAIRGALAYANSTASDAAAWTGSMHADGDAGTATPSDDDDASAAVYLFFIVAELCVVFTVAFLVHMYAAAEVKLEERMMVGFAWLVCLSIIAVIPIDVHTALVGDELEWLPYIWRFLYWATFALTWLVLPIHMGYVDAGDFTAWKKFKNSLSFNLYFYIALGAVCFVGVILVAVLGHMEVSTIVDVSIAASNTFGLLFGVVLLGYGLVEAPRSLWRTSNPRRRLEWYQVRIGQTHGELQEARYSTKKYMMVKDDIAGQLPRRDELRVYIDKINRKFEKQLPRHARGSAAAAAAPGTTRGNNRSDTGGYSDDDGDDDEYGSGGETSSPLMTQEGGKNSRSILDNIIVSAHEVDEATLSIEFDEDGLAMLRRKLRNAVSRMKRLEGKMEMLIHDGMQVSEFVGERDALRERLLRGGAEGGGDASSRSIPSVRGMLQFVNYQIRKLCSNEGLRRAIAALMGLVSMSIIFSETTIATRLRNLSVFSFLIRQTVSVDDSSGSHGGGPGGGGDEGHDDGIGGITDAAAYVNMFLVLIPVAYMCFCCYFSLFKLRLFTVYSLSLRQTDAYSLILNASLACRFAAPLCYNYLFMIHMAHKDGSIDTAFGELMGSQIDNVPFFGVHFNEYFPIVVLVYTATIYFRVFHKLVRILGMNASYAMFADEIQAVEDDDDDVDNRGRNEQEEDSACRNGNSGKERKKQTDEDLLQKSNWERDREVGRQILRRHMTLAVARASERAAVLNDEGGESVGLLGSMDGHTISSFASRLDDVEGGGLGRSSRNSLLQVAEGAKKLPHKGRDTSSSSTDRRFAEMKDKLRNKVEEGRMNR